MSALLFSAPPPDEERYIDHINRCRRKCDLIFPNFYSSVINVFDLTRTQYNFELLKKHFSQMVLFHDLGKLTKKWQEKINPYRPPLPSHSTIGAAYIWNILPVELKEPLSFAVAIHHTDKGLLGDNIERPHVQAILNNIVNYKGNIEWHDEVKNLKDLYFPKDIIDLNILSLKEMARGLRIWAKGCGLLEQHERRLQASLAHHILKLCDISAAKERKEYKKQDDQDHYGGWLMVENIDKYVENISSRNRATELKNELNRWENLLKREYNPEKIILFGSFVNGKIGQWSDIDMVIVKDTDKPFLDRIKDVFLLLHPKVGVDVLVYTPQEFKKMCNTKFFFKEEISSKGMILYER